MGFQVAAHVAQAADAGGMEIRREAAGCDRRGITAFQGAVFLLPNRQATIQHGDTLLAEDAEHPPGARGGEDALLIVNHHLVGVADAQGRDHAGEAAGGRHHVRQIGFKIRHLLDIEEARAGNMGGAVHGVGVLRLGRHVEAGIQYTQPRCAEPFGEPVGGDQGWFGHDVLHCARNQSRRAASHSRPMVATELG